LLIKERIITGFQKPALRASLAVGENSKILTQKLVIGGDTKCVLEF
jgi:hypothetical protein